MKAVLVIDMPEEYMGSVIDVKLYGKEKTVHETYVNKLKLMPQKVEMDMNEYYKGVANGWNDCIDTIAGETE